MPYVPKPKPTKAQLEANRKFFMEIVKQMNVKPCESCRFFLQGFCHEWGQDVPKEWQAKGCEKHRDVVVEKKSKNTRWDEGTIPF
jgi:hypothetical protein